MKIAIALMKLGFWRHVAATFHTWFIIGSLRPS
jgi:hypothetical protein